MSKERKKNACLLQRFIIAGLVKVYGKHAILTHDGGTWYLPSNMSIEIVIIFIFLLKKALWKNNYTTKYQR
jgi:hypothetical protein